MDPGCSGLRRTTNTTGVRKEAKALQGLGAFEKFWKQKDSVPQSGKP